MRFISLPAGAIPPVLALCLALAAAHSAFAASSSASGFEASFTAQKIKVGVGPIGAVSGSAPPAYSKTVNVSAFQQIVPIESGITPVPSLFATIASLKSHAASTGIEIDSESTEGEVTLKGLNVALMLNPPPPLAKKMPIEPAPYLNISAKTIQSGANLSQVFPRPATPSTSASFGDLVIFGSLVDNQTIKFTGNVPNNTVLFQSPTVTITANSRIIAGLISCSPKCVFSPVSVAGTALEIDLNDAVIDGKKVSGSIAIGQSSAGSGGLIAKTADFAPQ